MASGLTYDQLQQLADELRDTATTLVTALEKLELPESDLSEIEDELLDHDCELCRNCGWWFSTAELTRIEGDPTGKTDGLCDDCAAEELETETEDDE